MPIATIDLKLSDITYSDNLTYHYAGGVALGALKRWKEAEEFLEICASSPAQVPAAIQLEASKKLVLIQLILYGKVGPTVSVNHVLCSHATMFRPSLRRNIRTCRFNDCSKPRHTEHSPRYIRKGKRSS